MENNLEFKIWDKQESIFVSEDMFIDTAGRVFKIGTAYNNGDGPIYMEMDTEDRYIVSINLKLYF